MSFIVLVPARLHSSRLPRKPLLDIVGKPMVVRTAERAKLSDADRVVVATDDESIINTCRDFGVEAVLTKVDHPTGTDRLAEAVMLLHLADDDIVVNVQGDEPFIPPEIIDGVAAT